jgi:hypothetical protein
MIALAQQLSRQLAFISDIAAILSRVLLQQCGRHCVDPVGP